MLFAIEKAITSKSRKIAYVLINSVLSAIGIDETYVTEKANAYRAKHGNCTPFYGLPN
jgi:hypothetical protein